MNNLSARRPVYRSLSIAGCALALLIARDASASTVLTVSSGGIDTGTINSCTAANNCGTTTDYNYQSGGNVTGTITLTTSGSSGTATFNLQLNTPVQFTAGEQLTGGTFMTSTSIPITLTGGSWVQTGSPVYGTNSGIVFSTLTASENAPQVSGLDCTLSIRVCGFFLGPAGFEMTDSSSNTYAANLGFNVAAVPLPSTVWLALSGFAALGFSRRRLKGSL